MMWSTSGRKVPSRELTPSVSQKCSEWYHLNGSLLTTVFLSLESSSEKGRTKGNYQTLWLVALTEGVSERKGGKSKSWRILFAILLKSSQSMTFLKMYWSNSGWVYSKKLAQQKSDFFCLFASTVKESVRFLAQTF